MNGKSKHLGNFTRARDACHMVWRHDEAIVKSHQNYALKFNFPEGRTIEDQSSDEYGR